MGDEDRRGDAGQRGLAERDDERLARDPVLALVLGAPAGAQVADEAGVDRGRAAAGRPRDRELDRDEGAVRAPQLALEALLEDPRVVAVEQALQGAAVCHAPGGRDEQLGAVGADGLAARVAEHPLCGGVELEHGAARVERDDRVQRGAQDGIRDAGSGKHEIRGHCDTRRRQSRAA
jgi:hypothetical protein